MIFYLAQPYSIDPKKAYEEATRIQAMCLEAGYDVFSPIVHFHEPSTYMDSKPHSFWMRKCIPFLVMCDAVIFLNLEGYQNSKGMQIEKNYCLDSGKPFTEIYEKDVDSDICDLLGSFLVGAQNMQAQNDLLGEE